MRARVLLVWMFAGAILTTAGDRTRKKVMTHVKYTRNHMTDQELPIRKSLLFDVVNKQDLQTRINDEMGRIPWKSFSSDKKNEGDLQLSPQEATDLFKKLYNDVKIDGRSISTLKTQSVIQTDSQSLSSIEPLFETDRPLHVNDDRNRNMQAARGNVGPLQFVQPRTSSSLSHEETSVLTPMDSTQINDSPLGSNSALKIDATVETPTRPFQDVEEIIKYNKNRKPIAFPLSLDQSEVTEDALRKLLQQKTSAQDLNGRDSEALTPRIMEFQRLLNVDPKVLNSEPENAIDVDQQALKQQQTQHGINSVFVENELRNNANVDQRRLPAMQELLSATADVGNYKKVPQEFETVSDSDGPGERESFPGDQESRNAVFLSSEEDVPSPSYGPSANTEGGRNVLKSVFNAINRIEPLGSFNDIVVNPYSRGSLDRVSNRLHPKGRMEVDLLHQTKHSRKMNKPTRKQGHKFANHKNHTKGTSP